MTSLRSLAPVIFALALLQAGAAAVAVWAPLALVANGAGALAIGFVASGYLAGFLAGAVYAPRLLGRVGHIRAFAAAGAVATATTLVLALFDSAVMWTIWRIITGAAVAVMYAAGEGWIAESAPPDRRGRTLSVYMIGSRVAAILGPFVLAGAAVGEPAALAAAAALLALAAVPVAMTQTQEPDIAAFTPASVRTLFTLAPAAGFSAVAAGLIAGGVIALAPIFAGTLDPANPLAVAATFNAFLLAGGLVAQFPAGQLSDRFDRRIVMAGLAGLGAVSGVILWLSAGSGAGVVMALAFLFGAGALSFYGIAMAHAADRASPGRASSLMAAVLVAWGLGAAAGPLLSGLTAQAFGPGGVFLFAAVVLVSLAGTMAVRRRAMEPVASEDKGAFEPILATSPVSAELTTAAMDDAPDAQRPLTPSQGPADDAAAPASVIVPDAADVETPSTPTPTTSSAPGEPGPIEDADVVVEEGVIVSPEADAPSGAPGPATLDDPASQPGAQPDAQEQGQVDDDLGQELGAEDGDGPTHESDGPGQPQGEEPEPEKTDPNAAPRGGSSA